MNTNLRKRSGNLQFKVKIKLNFIFKKKTVVKNHDKIK